MLRSRELEQLLSASNVPCALFTMNGSLVASSHNDDAHSKSCSDANEQHFSMQLAGLGSLLFDIYDNCSGSELITLVDKLGVVSADDNSRYSSSICCADSSKSDVDTAAKDLIHENTGTVENGPEDATNAGAKIGLGTRAKADADTGAASSKTVSEISNNAGGASVGGAVTNEPNNLFADSTTESAERNARGSASQSDRTATVDSDALEAASGNLRRRKLDALQIEMTEGVLIILRVTSVQHDNDMTRRSSSVEDPLLLAVLDNSKRSLGLLKMMVSFSLINRQYCIRMCRLPSEF